MFLVTLETHQYCEQEEYCDFKIAIHEIDVSTVISDYYIKGLHGLHQANELQLNTFLID